MLLFCIWAMFPDSLTQAVWKFAASGSLMIRSILSRTRAHRGANYNLRGVRERICEGLGNFGGITWKYLEWYSVDVTFFRRVCWKCGAITNHPGRLGCRHPFRFHIRRAYWKTGQNSSSGCLVASPRSSLFCYHSWHSCLLCDRVRSTVYLTIAR